ncbi:AAA family ATPase [Pseudomonas lurida]|uniref:AAA family ATPase n=1 Tax=Pseudomonas lurida TaxID=244566 RepID=UPI00068D8791|nr:AAA family ATPase [Pseudomonas lurida]
MLIEVLPPRTGPTFESDYKFSLIQNNWNDYSYETQYSLVYLGPPNKRGHNLIGTVKILKKGQKPSDPLQLTSSFDFLTEDFVSVGQSLDYYQRLSELSDDLRLTLLESLNDYVFNPSLGDEFRSEEGWSISLFRYFNENDNFLLTSKSLLSKNFDSLQRTDLDFTFKIPEWDQEIRFDYSLPEFVSRVGGIAHPIPSRIISIIGRNGSGKSTLLARLARVAHGTSKSRQEGVFDRVGKIVPEGIGFPRIITVSYSAFDSFRLPGLKPSVDGEADERFQIIKDMEDGGGRFVFCGLRDIAAELAGQIVSEEKNNDYSNDKISTTLLKPVMALAEEFVKTLLLVKRNDASHILDRALRYIASDASFSAYQYNLSTSFLLDNNPKELFLMWSTGHKIVMQIIASLAAHTTQSSLILIDEPETHLHPPLLASLMHAIRIILSTKKAFAIVATHSPVVLQETLVRHTYLIRREGKLTSITKPNKETFGENIGTLTGETFGLNTRTTDFHKTLDRLIKEHKNLQVIESFFQPYGLSMQARAYVMSQLISEGHM